MNKIALQSNVFDIVEEYNIKVSEIDNAKAQLDKIGRMFWETTKITLNDARSFNDDDLRFDLKKSPYHGATTGVYHLISKDKENIAGRYLYRLSHPL